MEMDKIVEILEQAGVTVELTDKIEANFLSLMITQLIFGVQYSIYSMLKTFRSRKIILKKKTDVPGKLIQTFNTIYHEFS